MEQGTIPRWCKEQGEPVAIDEVLLELETDKAVFELPAPASGTLLRIDIPNGGAAVDQVVGWIGAPGEETPAREVLTNAVASDQTPATAQPEPTPVTRRARRHLPQHPRQDGWPGNAESIFELPGRADYLGGRRAGVDRQRAGGAAFTSGTDQARHRSLAECTSHSHCTPSRCKPVGRS